MIKEIVQDAINTQITREMYSSNLYLAMAAYYHSINLNGFAHWMRLQAQEEMTHALKFFDYLLDRGGTVKIGEISSVQSTWKGPLEAFEAALHHEENITARINELADLAIKESDHATSILLQWFITEQVEEEATTGEIVDRIRLASDSVGGLFMLDSELKSRVLTPTA